MSFLLGLPIAWRPQVSSGTSRRSLLFGLLWIQAAAGWDQTADHYPPRHVPDGRGLPESCCLGEYRRVSLEGRLRQKAFSERRQIADPEDARLGYRQPSSGGFAACHFGFKRLSINQVMHGKPAVPRLDDSQLSAHLSNDDFGMLVDDHRTLFRVNRQNLVQRRILPPQQPARFNLIVWFRLALRKALSWSYPISVHYQNSPAFGHGGLRVPSRLLTAHDDSTRQFTKSARLKVRSYWRRVLRGVSFKDFIMHRVPDSFSAFSTQPQVVFELNGRGDAFP